MLVSQETRYLATHTHTLSLSLSDNSQEWSKRIQNWITVSSQRTRAVRDRTNKTQTSFPPHSHDPHCADPAPLNRTSQSTRMKPMSQPHLPDADRTVDVTARHGHAATPLKLSHAHPNPRIPKARPAAHAIRERTRAGGSHEECWSLTASQLSSLESLHHVPCL